MQDTSNRPPRRLGRAGQLAILGTLGQALYYLLSIVLARSLDVEGFKAYAVAVALVTTLASLATRGLEKYAVRILPELFERGEWELARGYLRYALGRTATTAVVLAVAVAIGWPWWSPDSSDMVRRAVRLGCLALPVVAIADYGVEVLSAARREIWATAIYRVLIPTAALGLLGLASGLPLTLDGATAVACWGLAWTLGLCGLVFQIRRRTLQSIWRAAPDKHGSREWGLAALPFVVFNVLLTLIAQVGVIGLEHLQPSAAAVGAFAAAASTANLIVVLATSTSRFYAPRLSVLLERRDYDEMLRLRRQRRRWLYPTLAVYLAVTLGFSEQVLAVFRPEFVEDGVPALRILSISAAITVLNGMAPTYLQFAGRSRFLFRTAAVCTAGQLVLLPVLVPRYGATGAAIAYATAMCGMYAVSSWAAHREVRNLRAAAAAGST